MVAAWNGLAVAALAEAGALLDRPDLVAAARGRCRLLLDVHLVDGRLRRTSRDGAAGGAAGVLEDYADLAEGLLALHPATGDTALAEAAAARCSTPCSSGSPTSAGPFTTPPTTHARSSCARPRPTDNADPCRCVRAGGAPC